jgi:ornithine cyclodeaminase/alanine dehydrogenase-like protein (mu-crystallin family)
LERVLVAGRAAAPEFANWVQTELGVESAAVDAVTAAHEADVICTATRAAEPLFDGALVKAGAFVAAVGSSDPPRASSTTLLARADLIVVEWLLQRRPRPANSRSGARHNRSRTGDRTRQLMVRAEASSAARTTSSSTSRWASDSRTSRSPTLSGRR